MEKFFSKIVGGLKWVGQEISGAALWVPKVIKLTDAAEASAGTLLPQAIEIFEDVDVVVVAAVKDGGSDVTAAQALVAAILVAAQKDGIDIASDEAVVTAFNGFIAEVKDGQNFTDLLIALRKLTTDWDAFGAAAKAGIAAIEAAAAK